MTVPLRRCALMKYHRPSPPRIIKHHILPQAAGGKTVEDNLVWICDNHHYAIHELMYGLAQGRSIPPHASPAEAAYAYLGFHRAQAANTVHLIPNEG